MKIDIKVITPPKDALEKEAWKAIRKQIEQRLWSVQCPEHHQRPRLVVSGSPRKPEFKIEGCCQDLIDKAAKALQ